MRMVKHIVVLIVAVVVLVTASASARESTRQDVVNRLEEFRQFFVDFQMAPDRAVPGDLLAECYGVIIMRQYKAGLILGLRGGDGVILLRDHATGAWSPPAFVASAEGSFGFQIGGQSIDAIMLIMNRDGVDMLLKTRFKIGVDASAAAGPVGRDASAKVGPGTALLAYSRAKGLYAGMAFEGGAMLNHNAYNRAFYGLEVGLRDILMDGRVAMPVEAIPIIETLQSYSGPPRAARSGRYPAIPEYTPTQRMASPSMAPPPLPEPGPTEYYAPTPQQGVVYQEPPQPYYSAPPVNSHVTPLVSPEEQAALDAAAIEAQRAAQEAAETAREAQRAADAARGSW